MNLAKKIGLAVITLLVGLAMVLIGVAQNPKNSTIESKEETVKLLIIISAILALISFTMS